MQAARAGTQLRNAKVCQQVDQRVDVFASWAFNAWDEATIIEQASRIVSFKALASVEHVVAGDASCITAIANDF
jgi:hypothetical protein